VLWGSPIVSPQTIHRKKVGQFTAIFLKFGTANKSLQGQLTANEKLGQFTAEQSHRKQFIAGLFIVGSLLRSSELDLR
jgi:hypothetical protein